MPRKHCYCFIFILTLMANLFSPVSPPANATSFTSICRGMLSLFRLPKIDTAKYETFEGPYNIDVDFTLPNGDPAVDDNGHMIRKGPSLEPSSYIKSLAMMMEERPGLKGRLHNALVFHGSSSASLLFLRRPTEGLVPTGQLMRRGVAPFGGVNDFGIARDEGINRSAISTVYSVGLGAAIGFASTTSPWNPEIGLRQIREDGQKLNDCDTDSMEWARLEGRILLNGRRLEQWKDLTEQEKEWISNPFMILYGLRTKRPDAYRTGLGTPNLEINLVDGARADEIMVAFVIEEKIPELRKILDEHGLQHIFVEPIEATRKKSPAY